MSKDEAHGSKASSNRNEVTLGIMGEKIAQIEGSVSGMRTDIKELGQKIDDKYVPRVEHRAEMTEIKGDVDGLKDNQKWVLRLIIGIVISAIMGFILITK